MEKYKVTGMHCAACQARVEKVVSGVEGVESVAVNLLTNSMAVTGHGATSDIISAVEKAGYGASLLKAPEDSAEKKRIYEDMLAANEVEGLKKRLISSVVLLLILMYFSMGHTMLGLPIPTVLDGNPLAVAIIQMILAAIIMIINRQFFISGFRSLAHLAPNMDSLVAIGSMASFVWSIIVLTDMAGEVTGDGGSAGVHGLHGLYFESAAMIVTLITVGKLLEAISKGKTTDALKDLLELTPPTATVRRDGQEVEVPVDEVVPGDIFLCRAGDIIPVDGEIVEGHTAVDESALTGESVPREKAPGDNVSAGTVNTSGFITAKATHVGEDTTLARVIEMVSEASDSKAPIARIADKVSGIFVPVVIGIGTLVVIIWLLTGADVGYALSRGIAVLVISCPCALGLATPVAIMAGTGVGARRGILFKTAESVETAGRVDIVALDKTGTVTSGVPEVTDVIPVGGLDEDLFISYAMALEEGSEHPLGRAVTGYAKSRRTEPVAICNIEVLAGRGIEGDFEGRKLRGGSLKYIAGITDIPGEVTAHAEKLAEEGKTTLCFASGDEVIGLIAVADSIKEDSAEAVGQLHDMGIRTVMLTGDNEKTARAIAQEAGIDRVVAELLPQDKEKAVRKLMDEGCVAMVGDGINDAPALVRADAGIAIGAGTDIAIDSADIVIMNNRITDVAAAIRLGRATLRNIRENLFWAFFYNIILIPLAAGLFVKLMHGWTLSPMIAAAAMSISSFCVCMNALRLNFRDIYDQSRDRKRTARKRAEDTASPVDDAHDIIDREENEMTKTMKIEGMMCEHCEATVKKALEELEQVGTAKVSHTEGTALVELTSDIDETALIKAVEDRDYKVISVNGETL